MTHGMGDMAGKIALMQRDIQSASHNSPAVRQLRGCQAWADLVTLVHSMNRVAVSGEDEKRTVQHAKLEKLRDVLVDHFKQHGAEGKTRAIIFTQFRASVEEVRPQAERYNFVG
jgi:ERCC4-related helicase